MVWLTIKRLEVILTSFLNYIKSFFYLIDLLILDIEFECLLLLIILLVNLN